MVLPTPCQAPPSLALPSQATSLVFIVFAIKNKNPAIEYCILEIINKFLTTNPILCNIFTEACLKSTILQFFFANCSGDNRGFLYCVLLLQSCQGFHLCDLFQRCSDGHFSAHRRFVLDYRFSFFLSIIINILNRAEKIPPAKTSQKLAEIYKVGECSSLEDEA